MLGTSLYFPKNILEMKVYFVGYLLTTIKGDKDIFAVRVKYNVQPRDASEEDINFVELDGTINSLPRIKVTNVKAVAWGTIADRIYDASKDTRICIKGRVQSKIKRGYNEETINLNDEDYEVAIYYLRMLGSRGEHFGEKQL